MGIMDHERQIAAKCRAALMRDGIQDRFCFLILVAMAWDPDVSFEWVCDSMAAGYREAFRDKNAVRTHVIYKMLRAGFEEAPESYFARLAKEAAELEG